MVNTHHHGDHTFGNCLFPAAALIGHERTRAEALAAGPPRDMPFWAGPQWGELSLDPPFITFTDKITLQLGKRIMPVSEIIEQIERKLEA